jgi:hypothetical protein
VFPLPRKPTDIVTEQRFTLGNKERSQFDSMVRASNYRSVAVAVGGSGALIAGAGALFAGWAFMKFKAPDVIDDIKDLVVTVYKPVSDTLDTVADAIFPNSPVALRREAQDLAKRRQEVDKMMHIKCSLTWEGYTDAGCAEAMAIKDQYFLDLEAFQNHVIALTDVGGSLHHYRSAWWQFIFGSANGLTRDLGSGPGAINPNQDNDPRNDVSRPTTGSHGLAP